MDLPLDFDFDDAKHQWAHADWLEEQGELEEAEAVRAALVNDRKVRARQEDWATSIGLRFCSGWRFGFLVGATIMSPTLTASVLERRQFRFLRHLACRVPIDLAGVSMPSLETLEWMPDLSSANWLRSAPRLRRLVLDVRDASPEDVPTIERLVGCAGPVALTVVIHSRQVLEAVASRLRARPDPTTLALDCPLLFDDDVRALVAALALPVEVRASGSFEDDQGFGVIVSTTSSHEGPGLPVRSCCGHCLSLDAQEVFNDGATFERRCLQCGRYTSSNYLPQFEDPPPLWCEADGG